jgi:hypothetical protein
MPVGVRGFFAPSGPCVGGKQKISGNTSMVVDEIDGVTMGVNNPG